MAVAQTNLMTMIQMNLCCLLHISPAFGTKFTLIVVIKFLPLAIAPLQPFLGCHFGFYIFFTTEFLRAAHFFTAGLFWIRFHYFL